jgi:hypothetical protein
MRLYYNSTGMLDPVPAGGVGVMGRDCSYTASRGKERTRRLQEDRPDRGKQLVDVLTEELDRLPAGSYAKIRATAGVDTRLTQRIARRS